MLDALSVAVQFVWLFAWVAAQARISELERQLAAQRAAAGAIAAAR